MLNKGNDLNLAFRQHIMKVYLDIARGNIEHHVELSEHHQRLSEWLNAQHASYGLPPTVEELDEVQRETLQSLFEDANVCCSFTRRSR